MKTINLLTTLDEYTAVEKLRREVFNINNSEYIRYLNDLINKELYSYATRINNEMVAGCYFSVNYNILNIQQLFVKKSYQKTGANLGRGLVLYMLDNKKDIEKLTGKKIDRSWIYPSSDDAYIIFKKIGYESYGNTNFSMMYKSL